MTSISLNTQALGHLTTAELGELARDRTSDLAVLSAINEVLKGRNTDADNELQMRIAFRIGQLRRANGHQTTPGGPPVGRSVAGSRPAASASSNPVARFLNSLFERHRIAKADERPLCLYRLTDAEFDHLSELLSALSGTPRLQNPDRHSAALFVLYGSEWFRRNASGGVLRWIDLAPKIMSQLTQQHRTVLTETGLQYWGRPLRRHESGDRQLILSLALEGGIPVNALNDGGSSWLREFFAALIRRALSEGADNEPDILALAHEERYRLVQGYQDEDFLVLGARLIHEVLHWRRVAEEESAGIQGITVDPVDFLDHRHPEWRDQIPLHVPPGNATIVRDLINGLVREPIKGRIKGEIRITRLLLQDVGGRWRPAIQIAADGVFPLSALRGIGPSDGRCRAVPAGELARHMTGAFALFEPPGDDDKTWRVRPLSNLGAPFLDFAFAQPVIAEIVQSGIRRAFTWPGGEAIRSDVLVFSEEATSEDHKIELRLIGSGSVRASPKRLWLGVPQGWTVEDLNGAPIDPSEDLPALAVRLVSILEAARVRDPRSGDVYLVEPGAEPIERRIEASGRVPSSIEPEDPKLQLFCGKPDITLYEKGRRRNPQAGELCWRRPGSKGHDVRLYQMPAGRLDVVWGDPESGIQRDRLRLLLLPETVSIEGRMGDGGSATIQFSGLPGWKVHPPETDGRHFEVGDGQIDIAFHQFSSYFQSLILTPPGGESCAVRIPLATRDAALVLPDGSMAREGQQLALSDLRGASLVSPAEAILDGRLKASGAPPHAAFDLGLKRELPLMQLRPLFTRLLGLVADQDAVIELSIRGQRGRPWTITRSRFPRLTANDELVSLSVSTSAQAVALTLVEPEDERELERVRGSAWLLPVNLELPALIYLREGDEVVSRPRLLPGGSSASTISSFFSAIRENDHDRRELAFLETLREYGSGTCGAVDASWLLSVSTNLRGLTPTALDALALLPQIPKALVRLLAEASDDSQRRCVWDLENELPFLWLAQPIVAWRDVLHTYFERIQARLSASFAQKDAMEMAVEALRRKADAFCQIEPALAAVMRLCGLPVASDGRESATLEMLVQGHMRRMAAIDGEGHFDVGQSDVERAFNRCRNAGIETPPEFASGRIHDFFRGTLVAPFLLAAAATRDLELKADLQWLVRRAVHLDPDYVSAAYPLFVSRLLSGKS